MEDKKVYELSEPVEFKIRDKSYTIYPLSFSQLLKVKTNIDKLGKTEDMEKIIKLSSEITYDIISAFNEGITKKEIEDTFTLQAFRKLIEEGLGVTLPSIEATGKIIDKTKK